MKAISSDEMRKLESLAASLGIPARLLMENAGMKVATISAHEVKRARHACVICGTGGNGGDGFVAARYLNNMGIHTDIFLSSKENDISSPESMENLKVLKNMGLKVTVLDSEGSFNELKDSLMISDMAIDALVGIGSKLGDNRCARIIDIINATKEEVKIKRPYIVVSVDVPSGVDATTGASNPSTIMADMTITFEYPKAGLFLYPASKFSGKIITTSIGIPKPLIEHRPLEHEIPKEMEGMTIIDAQLVSGALPRRPSDSHKGSNGKVLIIGGSSGMMGAPVLSALSALRTGSGLVTLCVPDTIKGSVNTMSLEVVVSGFRELEEKLGECDVIAIGPGLSTSREAKSLVHNVLTSKKKDVPVIIDADALNVITDMNIFKNSGKEIVITPHPGEFSRLTGKSIEEIQHNRIADAHRFAADNGITVALKGAYSVVAGKNKEIYVNPVANPGMASAGMGDVLTGIIASLVGQGVNCLNAAMAGVYMHGMAGNMATSIKGSRGIIASDIIDAIPYTIESLL